MMATLGVWLPSFADRDEFDPFGVSHDHDMRRGRRSALSGLLGAGLPGAGDGAILVVFGSPRVGNAGFARAFNAAVPLAWRVEMERDVVTNMPKFCCLYSHVGTRVVLDEFGNVIIDPSPLERSLRVRSKISVASHRLVSYGQSLRQARGMEGMAQGDVDDADDADGDGLGDPDGTDCAKDGALGAAAGSEWERALV
jgi:hypothetical protein